MDSFNSLINDDINYSSLYNDSRSYNLIIFTLILNVITFLAGVVYYVTCEYLNWDVIGADWAILTASWSFPVTINALSHLYQRNKKEHLNKHNIILFDSRTKYILLTIVPLIGLLMGTLGFESNIKNRHLSSAIWAFILTINCFFTTNYLLIQFTIFRASESRKKSMLPKHFFSDDIKVEERKQMEKRSLGQRILISFLLLLVILISFGFIILSFGAAFQSANIAFLNDNTAGNYYRVDNNKTRVHILCMGTGSPTIVLGHDWGGSSQDWGWIQPTLSAFTRVCAFDRPGYGWSQEGAKPRNTEKMVEEMKDLFDQAGLTEKLILVGYSFSAYNMRVFANLNPKRVVGVVFVDSPDPENQNPSGLDVKIKAPARALVGHQMNPFSGIRFLVLFGAMQNQSIIESLPQVNSTWVWSYYHNIFKQKYWATYVEEAEFMPQSAAFTNQHGYLGSIPLINVVASRGYNQVNLTSASTRGKLVVIDSDHYIINRKPSAQILAKHILGFWNSLR